MTIIKTADAVKLETELAELAVQENSLREELKKSLRATLVLCQHCRYTDKINELTYYQTHFYIPPRGCTEGDYWKHGEGRFVCPKCQKTNRLYDRPEVEALKPYFKQTEDVYDK